MRHRLSERIFFFQAEDGIRDVAVTGVQTCALPIYIATFKEYRAHGGLIGFAPDPRTGHECGDSRYLAIPFLDACLAARLPDKQSKDQTLKPMDTSKAWLAPLFGDEAVPAA